MDSFLDSKKNKESITNKARRFHMRSFITKAKVRVKVSDKEAEFYNAQGTRLDNATKCDKWYNVPAGSRVTLVARFEGTDTYLIGVREKVEGGGLGTEFGMTLRRAGWDNLREASDEVVAAPPPAEIAQPAATEPSTDSVSEDEEAELRKLIGDEG